MELDRAHVIGSLYAEKARRSFAEFVRQGWHVLEPNGRPFLPNAGTDAIIEHLQAVGDGEIQQLLIAISPGFGKSTLASIAFPAWMWTRNPSWRVICASHAMKLAEHLAKKFQAVIGSDWYRASFGIDGAPLDRDVTLDAEPISAFRTTRGGLRFAVGVDGALTGIRGDAAIVDDSLNAVDAHSEKIVTATNDWFDTALSNRLDRGETAPLVVIQQRLAEGDLIGHLLAKGGWEALILPAEFDPRRRCSTSIWTDRREAAGEVLAPMLQTPVYLAKMKIALGPYGYASQFQQQPAPAEGGDIKRAWWRFFRLHEADVPVRTRPRGCDESPSLVAPRRADGSLDLDWLDVSVDATFGALNAKADSVGLLIVGGKGQRRFVFDDATKPMTFLDSVAAVKAAIVRSGAKRVLVEKKANGAAIIEQLQAAMAAGDLRDARGKPMLVRVEAIEPEGGKVARAAAMTPAIAAGMVHLLDGAPWLEALIGEHAMFPAGQHDDRVDALSQCLNFHAEAALDRVRALAGVGQALAGGLR